MKIKTFEDYVREHDGNITYDVITYNNPSIIINAKIINDNIAVFVNGKQIEYVNDYDLMDYIEENYGAEIRFCTYCGGIMQSGMTDEEGDFYNHEECFPLDMDERYGKGNWRSYVNEDGEECENWMGGYYEYKNEHGEWEPEPSFYTEWY